MYLTEWTEKRRQGTLRITERSETMIRENVLLLVIDTARADVVREMMGNGQLPALSTLADEGLEFTNAVSPSPWTLPAHASMFTGQRASAHGAHAGTKRFDPEGQTVAEHLRRGGYRTVGISGNIWISPEFGFDRGFDHLSMKYDRFWSGANLTGVSEAETLGAKLQNFREAVDIRTVVPTLVNGLYSKWYAENRDKGAANTTRRTREWLRRHADDREPFFYFINYLEPHLPYEPRKEFAEPFLPDGIGYEEAREIEQDAWGYIAGDVEYSEEAFETLRALYRGELGYIDRQIGKLLTELEEQGLRDGTTIVVVGDHGENIGDHGLMDHQYCLYQTLVRVPLMIDGPGVEPGEVSALVETRDIFPTVLDVADLTVPDDETISDNTLLEDPGRPFAISEYLAPQPSMESLREWVGETADTDGFDRTLRAIQTDTWKLVEGSDGSVELYDLSEDPGETESVASEASDVVEELRRELDRNDIPLAYRESGEFGATEASRQRLEDLGYI